MVTEGVEGVDGGLGWSENSSGHATISTIALVNRSVLVERMAAPPFLNNGENSRGIDRLRNFSAPVTRETRKKIY
jgi:hypothetical protein